MHARRRIAPPIIAFASLGLLVAGCRPAPGPGPTTSTTFPTSTSLGQPPPDVVVEGGGTTLALRPYTWCYAGLCADGIPSEDPPSVGSPAEVTLRFPLPGWNFSASFLSVGRTPATTVPVPVVRAGTAHRITATVPPGDYRVMIFGAGPGGDIATTFAWTVTG